MYKSKFQDCIQEKNLHAFYAHDDPRLDAAAEVAAAHIDQVCAVWKIPVEKGQVLAKLALFDVVLYIDNSGSMRQYEDDGRIEELRSVVALVVDIVRLFDSDGFGVRYMNGLPPGMTGALNLDHVKDATTINKHLDNPFFFQGLTPLGTQLRSQVLDDIVTNARAKNLPKPVLVITITDGVPYGEPERTLREVILYATKALAQTKYKSNAVSFQFAQVGKDQNAHAFLEQLDIDPVLGDFIDCTSGFETESAQMRVANPPIAMDKPLWMLKILMGAIDDTFDKKDEAGSSSGPRTYAQPSSDDWHGPPAQQKYDQKAASQDSRQEVIPEGAPPSYDDSLQPPQVYGQQGSAESSRHRSIVSRSKDVFRSLRRSKGS